jgi:hypothetical protein
LFETEQALMSFDITRDLQGSGARRPSEMPDNRGSCTKGGKQGCKHQAGSPAAPPSNIVMSSRNRIVHSYDFWVRY